MRAFLAIACAAVAFGCGPEKGGPSAAGGPKAAAGLATGWKEFSSARDGFKVSFPWGAPTERPFFFGNDPQGVSQTTNYSAEKWDKEEVTHNFSLVAARLRKGGPKAAPDAAADGTLANAVPPKMKRSEPAAITWAGRPAQEYKCEPEDPQANPTRLVIRRLVTDSAVYLGIVRDKGDLTPAEVARFYDSFQLTAGPAKK